MDFEAINKLIDTLIEKQVEEFELEEGELRIFIKRQSAAPASATPPATATAVPVSPAVVTPSVAPAAEDEGLVTVRSPIVGTFYTSPSPGSPEFIKIGDTVEVGQVLCIIEAMKLMNEIEAEVAGTVIQRLVTNGQPVEYGEKLYIIRPTGK
ncbi:MAG: acetyl-CoA carboxylase biotin carboxyl carrier protein [Terriglobales bacterium]